jgi:RNA polymerase sigma factor (sigma-70 family)
MVVERADADRQPESLWSSETPIALSDSELLSRYVNAGERVAVAEEAFRELVNRHGPMVLGVCRQILRHQHDADDAFQATFLVLVRKARSIQVGDSVAPWLSSVAYRTAHRARKIAARYLPIEDMKLAESASSCAREPYLRDFWPFLHEELDRLPGKFRDAIVLCHLEGKSQEEAARMLRWPVGTVSSRLSRGRRLLRLRLERRGVLVSSAVFSSMWLAGTKAAVAAPLVESTISISVGASTSHAVPALVLSLTRGVLRTMWIRKLVSNSVAVLLIGVTSGSLGVWAHWPKAASGKSAAAQRSGQTLVAATAGSPSPDGGSASDAAPPSLQPEPPAESVHGLPADCPLSIAATAIHRMIDHVHGAPDVSH